MTLHTKGLAIAFVILTGFAAGAHAQETPGAAPSPLSPWYVGTSAFTLMNLATDDQPPHFYQVNVGYRLTSKDRLSVEATTWRYYHPLGIPWGEEGGRESADKAYPGHVREFGVGLEYQRSLTKGLFTSISATPFFRRYYDEQNEKIGNGLQLYLTTRVGYQVRVSRLFLEPSVAINYWPVSTNVPAGFAAQDDRWPSYFCFEPGLNVGFTF